MKRRVRALAVVTLLFGPAACGRSCGCMEGEKTYERLDGKVKVELVRKVHWTGGKIPGPETDFFLRVHTAPVIEHPIECPHVDMAEDDAGKVVAYRCRGGDAPKSWSVLRLRGENRYLFECEAPVGDGRKPAYDKLEPLSRAADRIVGCSLHPWSHGASADAWEELVRALEEDEGRGAAVAFLVRRAEQPHRGSDVWEETVSTIAEPTRAAVLAGVCPALARADAAAPLSARAAAWCPLEVAGVGEAAVAQLRALVTKPSPREDEGLARSHRLALRWAAVIAVSKARDAAGAAVCASAASIPAGASAIEEPEPRDWAIGVLAAAKTRCPAIAAWFERPPCSPDLDCDGGLCTASELGVDVERWVTSGRERLDGGARAAPLNPPKQSRARLALAYLEGPLPKELVVPNARRRYEWPDASPDLPSCESEDAGAGTPCGCRDTGSSWRICEVPASTTRGELGACSFHFDDAKKRIDDVKRTCVALAESCLGAKVCCGGLRCDYDGGVATCRPKPVRDAGAGAGEAGAVDAR